ncbi:DUF6426 family protein [Streptomyces nojiriensis]|uniref:DUF6426 family protein n=1 Tax=Streptomyces nojiriensis TaxID=66374 RepID=UPI0035D9FF44
MKLRTSLAAVAVGASLLTAVPAAVAPNMAAAVGDCYILWPRYDDAMGCATTFSETINWSNGNIGDTYDMTRVEIVGKAQRVDRPIIPFGWDSVPDGSSGGPSGGSGGSAMPYSYGQKWNVVTDCLQNNSGVDQEFKKDSTYTVNYEVSANASVKAVEILNASLGTKVSATETRTTGWKIAIKSGQRMGLAVEYQTITYLVSTGSRAELVNVTAPTATVYGVPC